YGDHVKKELIVKIYFTDTVTGKQVDAVRKRLASDQRVKSFRFVSKEQALAIMRKKYPDLVKNLAYNPLPASEEVTPKKGDYTPAIARTYSHPVPPGVDKVKYGASTTKKILHYANVFNLLFAIALVILLVASTLLIANTIRLSIFSRRREIEVMKLVGATN